MFKAQFKIGSAFMSGYFYIDADTKAMAEKDAKALIQKINDQASPKQKLSLIGVAPINPR